MNLRRRIAQRLHFLADRIAPEDAFKGTGMTFYLDWTWKLDTDGVRGAKVWYHGDAEYAKACEAGVLGVDPDHPELPDFKAPRGKVTFPDDYGVTCDEILCESEEKQIFSLWTNPKRPLTVGELIEALSNLDPEIPMVLENSITGNDDEHLHAVSLDDAYEHTLYKRYPDGTVAAFSFKKRLVLFFDQMEGRPSIDDLIAEDRREAESRWP